MGRLLLGALPMWALAVVYVVLPALVALGVGLLLRRRWRSGADGSYSETAGTLLTTILAIYGLVLAFVIVNQYADFNETRTSVQTEALNVEDLYRSSLAFAPADRAEVSEAVGDYARAVVDQEWPALSDGRSSPETAAAFSRLYAVMRDHPPTDDVAMLHYANGLGFLHTAHDARHRRLDAAGDTLPGTLSAFLLLGALASVGSTLLLGLRSHQLLVPMSLAALIGFTLLLSLTLDHPFVAGGISPVHFTQGDLATFFEGRPAVAH